jgi:hypothetical protein
MKKKIAIILFAALLSMQLISCSDAKRPQNSDITSNETAAVIKNDISTAEFAGRFDTLLKNAAMLTAVDDDYVTGMLGLNLDNVSEYVLKVQTSGTEVDQYGIFKTTDEKEAEKLSVSVRAYLDMLNDNWENFSYLPEEMPKIKAAEVKSAGVYVVFVTASEEEKTAVFDEFYAMINK